MGVLPIQHTGETPVLRCGLGILPIQHTGETPVLRCGWGILPISLDEPEAQATLGHPAHFAGGQGYNRIGATLMAIVRTRKRKVSEEEFMRLPDNGRKYELVNGEVVEVPAGIRHDALVMRIGVVLHPYTHSRGVLCGSSAGYRLNSGNVRSPDVSFILNERLPEGKPPIGFAEFAPDLAIEILSPSEDASELLRKIAEYFESGAKQVWVVDPDARRITIYRSPVDVQIFVEGDIIENNELLPDFRCRVSELLGE